MLLHNTKLVENKDGSLTLDAELFGNAAHMKSIRAGGVTAFLVKEDPKNSEQLNLVITITPAVAKPLARSAAAVPPGTPKNVPLPPAPTGQSPRVVGPTEEPETISSVVGGKKVGTVDQPIDRQNQTVNRPNPVTVPSQGPVKTSANFVGSETEPHEESETVNRPNPPSTPHPLSK